MRETCVHCFKCLCAGNVGEIVSLRHSLAARTDIRVNVGNWRWTKTSPFPPINLVLQAIFWSNDRYMDVRKRLQKPAPVLESIPGSEYGSCQLMGGGESAAYVPEDPYSEIIDEPGAPTMQVCDPCIMMLPCCSVCVASHILGM